MIDELGDRMKAYEKVETGRTLDPNLPIYARLDGRCFSTFTRGFKKPYEEFMLDAMEEVTLYLVEKTGASMGYVQSDEISLVWHYPDEESQPFFGGKQTKLNSVLASMASAKFVAHLYEMGYPHLAKKIPSFDCRTINLPSQWEAVNMLRWRYKDATRNAIQSTAQSLYSHKQLNGVSTTKALEMINDKVNFESYDNAFRYGVFVTPRGECITKRDFMKDPNVCKWVFGDKYVEEEIA